jgi:hypothetical protein
MKIAFYKGPVGFWDDPVHWITHWAVCIKTLSKYSHVELEIKGICYSSSVRDHGVRGKVIDLNNGKWDIIDIGDEGQDVASKFFKERIGEKYDWNGIIRFLLPFVKQKRNQYFCSEAVAAALGFKRPEDFSPGKLYEMINRFW